MKRVDASSPSRSSRPRLARPLRGEDFEALVKLQVRCFPGIPTWKQDQLESQILTFLEPDRDRDRRRVEIEPIVEFDDYDSWHNWRDIADGGYIRDHDPAGDTLYGIEIMVDPEYRGYRLSRRLYEARKEIAREKNLRRIIGGRIPGYGEVADRMSAREQRRPGDRQGAGGTRCSPPSWPTASRSRA